MTPMPPGVVRSGPSFVALNLNVAVDNSRTLPLVSSLQPHPSGPASLALKRVRLCTGRGIAY